MKWRWGTVLFGVHHPGLGGEPRPHQRTAWIARHGPHQGTTKPAFLDHSGMNLPGSGGNPLSQFESVSPKLARRGHPLWRRKIRSGRG